MLRAGVCEHGKQSQFLCTSEKCQHPFQGCRQLCLQMHEEHRHDLIHLKDLATSISEAVRNLGGKAYEATLLKIDHYFNHIRTQMLKTLNTLEEEAIIKLKNSQLYSVFGRQQLQTIELIAKRNFSVLSKEKVLLLSKAIRGLVPRQAQEIFNWMTPQELGKRLRMVTDSIKALSVQGITTLSKINLKEALDEMSQKPSFVLSTSKILGKLCEGSGKEVHLVAVGPKEGKQQEGESRQIKTSTLFDCLQQATGAQWQSLQLLYRASESNYQSKHFKKACAGEKDTLVLITSTKNRIFGGFTPCMWPQAQAYQEDQSLRSFVFSLSHNNSVLTKFCLRPRLKKYAVSSFSTWGPIFGSPYGPDLAISTKCDDIKSQSTMGSYYQLPQGVEEHSTEAKQLLSGQQKFLVLDYEVYRINFRSP